MRLFILILLVGVVLDVDARSHRNPTSIHPVAVSMLAAPMIDLRQTRRRSRSAAPRPRFRSARTPV